LFFFIHGNNYIKISRFYIYIYPIIGSLILIIFSKFIRNKYIVSYILFFITTITTYLNFTNPMSGNFTFNSNIYLLGVSFYTVSLSYIMYVNGSSNFNDILVISNPLLIITGPVLIFYKKIVNSNLKRRIKIYMPYLVLGLFFYQIISIPITQYFVLFKNSNSFITLAYGIIFELFIYFNFAGISLIIYGLFGIMGVSIPLNFRQPFSSRNLIEFWKGWHISLSIVLKQLFYNPIRNKYNKYLAICIVYLTSGLWHGTTFNFIIWGIFHAIFYIITIFLLSNNLKYLSTIIMLLVIPIGRILFSEINNDQLKIKLQFQNFNIYEINNYNFGWNATISLTIGFLIVLAEFIFAKKLYFRQRTYKFYRKPISQIIILLLIFLLITKNSGINFAAYGQR
jgi:alginate O-acetyltransferase complex protein AlgI